jgi:Tfp pilus assembly protein PilV
VILLEVLIALSLFVIGAGVIGMAVRSSLEAMRSSATSMQAANLAQSILTKLEAGMLPIAPAGATPIQQLEAVPQDADAGWTFEVAVEEVASDYPSLKRVTVTIRSGQDIQPAQVCQLSQWMNGGTP